MGNLQQASPFWVGHPTAGSEYTAKPLGTTHRMSHCPWKDFLCQQPGLGNRTGNFCNTQKASTRPISNLSRDPDTSRQGCSSSADSRGTQTEAEGSNWKHQSQGRSPHCAGRHCSSITCHTHTCGGTVLLQGSFWTGFVGNLKENPNQFTKSHNRSLHLSARGVHCTVQSTSSWQ